MKETLKQVLGIPSSGSNNILLAYYIISVAQKLKCKILVDSAGNILITKGKSKIYPCVTAHLDTVHSYTKMEIEEKKGELSSPTGIGGDDKCGIYICLEILKRLNAAKVVFFAKEEIGCVGSGAVDLTWFNDCGYIIGIDRRGNSDYINSHWGGSATGDEFESTIKPVLDKYKYKETTGLITDVFTLAERFIGLSVCNVSCGYYEPHTFGERVVIKDVYKSLSLVLSMIRVLGLKKYPYIKPKPVKKERKWISTSTRKDTGRCLWCDKYVACKVCTGFKPLSSTIKRHAHSCYTCNDWATCAARKSGLYPTNCHFWEGINKKEPIVCSGCHQTKRGEYCSVCKSPHNEGLKKKTFDKPQTSIVKIDIQKKDEMRRCGMCELWFYESELVKSAGWWLCSPCKEYSDKKNAKKI